MFTFCVNFTLQFISFCSKVFKSLVVENSDCIYRQCQTYYTEHVNVTEWNIIIDQYVAQYRI